MFKKKRLSIPNPHFTDEETEVQRIEVIHSNKNRFQTGPQAQLWNVVVNLIICLVTWLSSFLISFLMLLYFIIAILVCILPLIYLEKSYYFSLPNAIAILGTIWSLFWDYQHLVDVSVYAMNSRLLYLLPFGFTLHTEASKNIFKTYSDLCSSEGKMPHDWYICLKFKNLNTKILVIIFDHQKTLSTFSTLGQLISKKK